MSGEDMDSAAFYDRLGPSGYEMITRLCNWQGPEDMADLLQTRLAKGMTVADIGIGNGPLSATFRRAGVARIIGIDGAPSHLEYCRANNLADETALCDVARYDLPLADAEVHAATCSGLFAYLASVDVLSSELARITRKKGIVAVNFHPASGYEQEIEHMPASSFSRTPAHVKVYHHPAGSVQAAFAAAGMELEAERHNKAGIFRAQSGAALPLLTQVYRKQ